MTESNEPTAEILALWQGQGNELVRSLQDAFARALGQVAQPSPGAPAAVGVEEEI